MSVYTPELVAALEAQDRWTYAEAVEFAAEHGLKHRSVIAKVKSLGLEYEPKPARVTKRGEPVVTKAQLVEAIESAIGVTVGSLVKVSKGDLEKMVPAVGATMPQPKG